MKKLLILLFLSLFLISACNIPQEIKVCTAEGKVCPDGSVVGRIGPNCEFEKCPSNEGKVIDVGSYKVDITCAQDRDCILVNKELQLGCCDAGRCQDIDYSQEKWVAVNSQSFNILKGLKCPELEDCPITDRWCEDNIINENYYGKCVNNLCKKEVRIKPARDEPTDLNQGAYGAVEYGEGDCMPPLVDENIKYSDFNGYIYFVDAVKFMGGGNYPDEEYFEENQKTKINNGYYEIKLEKGNYYAIPNKDSNVYYYIPIEDNQVIKKDIKFFKCLTY